MYYHTRISAFPLSVIYLADSQRIVIVSGKTYDKEDWKQGRIILPPNDNKEFISLLMIIQNRQEVHQNQNRFHSNCEQKKLAHRSAPNEK